ncbi:hypothetical protein [Aureibacter tunicatorum]|uniref:Outer membrane protein assembly factor BamB n=1 Tax=Aureibacter tunicatorum TaxID=866807 RepID=A0AAE4BSQ8_9BACT|nr:hypothetical protein [Aureibacter tunicatorum]MDR6241464.1 outer membrane protein assembly factor BamB [Aureibacter tunicatorum]BDD06693.1 hypothetical protein AUTU_41760 [Aureibacter tunicatorum]
MFLRNILLLSWMAMATIANAQQSELISQFDAPKARQAVVATDDAFFVVDNRTIIKRDKQTGDSLAVWTDKRLDHLNSAILIDSLVYCAHSNYPQIPMSSTIEIFDPKTMTHVGNHSFGIEFGSATWIDEYEGHFYVMFAHYDRDHNRQRNRDVSWTQLVKFDKEWRKVGAWILPKELVERTTPYSISGGIFMEDGRILATHHHHSELYVLSIPSIGSQLVWEHTFESSIKGQGIALDPLDKNILWGIDKKNRQVLKTKLTW